MTAAVTAAQASSSHQQEADLPAHENSGTWAHKAKICEEKKFS